MSFAIAAALASFARTRWLARRLSTRAHVEAWREARLARFLRGPLRRAPFYADLGAKTLADLPIMDKAALLANFERLNIAGVTLAEARAALDAGQERVRGLVVGQSTGTSGNRGVFVISEAERYRWLGVILAKALPDFPFARHKVALALPGYSQLYASAAETGRLAIRFFDLALGVERWRADLAAFAPDTLVAPPKVLRLLAEGGGLPAPAHVFSGAEVLDSLDRAVIEAAFGTRVREIYMATEGLFGVACPHGTLHLAEDVVAFEWAPAPGGELSAPLTTDFTRRTQIMARYRMNDLLRLADAPCPCGSPLRAVARIEGRQDDIFQLPGAAGIVPVTPDVIRNAVVDADRRIQDFRVVQTGPDQVTLTLAADLPPEAAEAAAAALAAAFARIGAGPVAITPTSGLTPPMDAKLRRVRREWKPEAAT